MLINKKRISLINDIKAFYANRLNDHNDIVEVDLTVSDENSSSIAKDIENLIAKKLSKKLKLMLVKIKRFLADFH